MRRQTLGRVRVVITALSVLVTATTAAVSSSETGAAADDKNVPILSWERVHPEDRVASNVLAYIATRSPTMRDMLRVLAVMPGFSVRLRSQPGLNERSWRQGHGVLSLEGANVNAVLEFDTRATFTSQLEMVAHEISHVVEVACLPSNGSGGSIGSVLLQRGFSARLRQGVAAIETLFAVDAGRTVTIEALARRTGPGALPRLARKYGLGMPCADPATAVVAVTPRGGR